MNDVGRPAYQPESLGGRPGPKMLAMLSTQVGVFVTVHPPQCCRCGRLSTCFVNAEGWSRCIVCWNRGTYAPGGFGARRGAWRESISGFSPRKVEGKPAKFAGKEDPANPHRNSPASLKDSKS